MSNMNGRTRNKLYMIIVRRDDESCKFCIRSPPEVNLVIDHKDNDNKNNNLNNLQLVCRSCNYKKNPRRPLAMCVNKEGRVRFDSISINQEKEPKFREYVYRELEEGRAVWDDLVDSGAELVGVSIATTKKYLVKMVSKTGKLEKVPTFNAGWAVRYKEST